MNIELCDTSIVTFSYCWWTFHVLFNKSECTNLKVAILVFELVVAANKFARNTILVKQIKYAIAKPLTHIFNLSLTSGIFPEKIKLSEVIPLYKKGHKDQVTNYRPISLLVTLSKILEKCLYTWIYKFLGKNNIFYKKQYGFLSFQSLVWACHPKFIWPHFTKQRRWFQNSHNILRSL